MRPGSGEKRERLRRLKKANEEHNQNKEGEGNAIEEADYFEKQTESTVEEDFINEGKPTVQDLLKIIKIAGLQDALPWYHNDLDDEMDDNGNGGTDKQILEEA
eukprot:gene1685-1878_t